MGALEQFRRIINNNSTFQNRTTLDENKIKAREFLEQKNAFISKFEEMKNQKLKTMSCQSTFQDMKCFETYLLLKDGILAGIKNTEDDTFYFEFAFPKSKTKKTYNYYYVTEFTNNSQLRPNFDIVHIIDEEGKCLLATTFVRTAVVTAPMQPTTEIIAPGIDKTLGIDFVALHKSMPISLIKDLIIGDTNLKHKAISDRQLFQIHKIKQGL